MDIYLIKKRFYITTLHYLGEGNGKYSSTLAWRIPWMEELGGLQSMGRKESDTTEATQHTL